MMMMLLAALVSVTGADVIEMTPSTMAKAVSRHKRIVVFMYDGACPASAKFQPWLFAMSQLMPRLAFARIDVSGPGHPVAATFQVSSSPAIKMFQRESQAGERVIDYQGPLKFDDLVEWCRTLVAGKKHAHSTAGFEPPEHAAAARAAKDRSEKSNALNGLPASVRAMAETMVREQRLQRVLKQRGNGMTEKYEDLVSTRYQQLVADEGIDVNDKFASQEANRRARDSVRDELLDSAPADIREEIEREVHLGASKSQGDQEVAKGTTKGTKKRAKKTKEKARRDKDEL